MKLQEKRVSNETLFHLLGNCIENNLAVVLYLDKDFLKTGAPMLVSAQNGFETHKLVCELYEIARKKSLK